MTGTAPIRLVRGGSPMPDTAGPVILVIAVVAVALLCGLGWGE